MTRFRWSQPTCREEEGETPYSKRSREVVSDTQLTDTQLSLSLTHTAWRRARSARCAAKLLLRSKKNPNTQKVRLIITFRASSPHDVETASLDRNPVEQSPETEGKRLSAEGCLQNFHRYHPSGRPTHQTETVHFHTQTAPTICSDRGVITQPRLITV